MPGGRAVDDTANLPVGRRVHGSPDPGADVPPPAPSRRYPTGDELLDAAATAAGLDDFGPGDFREGLDVLLDSLEHDTDLDPATDDAVIATLRRRLVNRLELERWYGEHPELDQVTIDGPVDVVGLPRTGTTALGNLLSLDPQLRPLRGWEQVTPVPPPTVEGEATDPRRLDLLAEHDGLPDEIRAMHIYEVDAAMEDSDVLGMAFHGQQYTLPIWSYHRWWRGADLTDTYRYHRRVIALLGSRRPPDRWLFKAPHHKFHLEALVAAYPDVRFVMTHRDPARVVPSYASLVSTYYPPARTDHDLHRVGRETSEHLRQGMEQAIAARRRLGDDRFLDIHHGALAADPLGTIRRVYDFLGLDLTPAVQAAMADWHRVNRSGAHGTHRYTPEQYGLRADRIRSDYDFYIRHFDVDVEG